MTHGLFQPTTISLATAYADQNQEPELVIPEDLTAVEYEQLKELYSSAEEAFNAIYAESDVVSSEVVDKLKELTVAIESLAEEIAKRDNEAAERAEEAEELANRVKTLSNAQDDKVEEAAEEGQEAPVNDSEDSEAAEEVADIEESPSLEENEAEKQPVAASARRKETRVSLAAVKRKAPAPTPQATKSMKDIAFSSGEGTGFAAGSGMNWLDVGKAIDRKLTSANSSQFVNAAKIGKHVREHHSILSIKREFPSELTISSNDQTHVDEVMSRAVDEKRLPQGSLVAAGGWCAPSETLYDLLELETTDGLLSLPEVGIARGGINFAQGPNFADLFSSIPGFHFTEEDDVDGLYAPGADGNVEGEKPCYTVECPDFAEARLEASGLCIRAGLLMSRGYPEVIARTVRGAMVAHQHRINGLQIARMEAGSTAVTMPSVQVGATAPVLTAIELQVEHYRTSHRMAANATLEAVFPMWVRGAVRSDLSRRLGVDLLSVPNARIDGWFRERGVNPQFVYNWQAVDGVGAAEFTQWPSTVKFMLYSAGTWVRGSNDIITLDTLYDSTLLANNDYTALFTEEGWLVAKRGFDSRVVSLEIEANGYTNAGGPIDHDGTAGSDATGA